MNNYLFVYGTLMKKYNGYKPFNLEQLGDFVCNAFVYGRLYEIDFYPGLVLSTNENEKVFGEIYSLNNFEDTIKKLDEYEDYFLNNLKNSLYKREILKTYLENGRTMEAWVYIFIKDIDEKKRIISGNFLNFG